MLGAFISGGNPQGLLKDVQNRYELQNYTSIVHGKHFIKFGARLRVITDSNQSTGNFNGTFTFPSIQAYQVTEIGLQAGLTPAQSLAACLASSRFHRPHNAAPANFRLRPVASGFTVNVG